VFDGLSDDLVELLDRRWGGFLAPATVAPSDLRLRLVRWDRAGWLTVEPGELYRIEAVGDEIPPSIVSYNFAVVPDVEQGGWVAGVRPASDEPVGRLLDNVARYLTARIAIQAGGFALHAAGVLREDKAWLFAGVSNSGKTTAVHLSRPCVSLGDDMGLVAPGHDGWEAWPLPFDNSEHAPREAPGEAHPLAGIWRLHQADAHAVERPPTGQAVASLMSCCTFPWALPDETERLFAHVTRFVLDAAFSHLHFRRDPGFWDLLLHGSHES
jgi:hypothetical protein